MIIHNRHSGANTNCGHNGTNADRRLNPVRIAADTMVSTPTAVTNHPTFLITANAVLVHTQPQHQLLSRPAANHSTFMIATDTMVQHRLLSQTDTNHPTFLIRIRHTSV